jgi:hypothetical protein
MLLLVQMIGFIGAEDAMVREGVSLVRISEFADWTVHHESMQGPLKERTKEDAQK